tara:strand:+ start:11 stop:718 length:708 start_codon:yes stop_codon:yes gene_type:complete
MINTKVLIVIAIIAISIVLYYIDRIQYGDRNIVTTKSQYMIKKKSFEPNKYIFSKDHNGIASTLSFWLYVKDWNYKFMEYKNILRKGKLDIYMPPKNNFLVLEIPILGGKKEIITFKKVPLQKWLNVTIILDNRHADLWINGKLYISKYLNNVPDLDNNENLICADNKGFDGYLSRITTWKEIITKSTIVRIFKAGSEDSSYLTKFKKIYGKVANKFGSKTGNSDSDSKVKCSRQ